MDEISITIAFGLLGLTWLTLRGMDRRDLGQGLLAGADDGQSVGRLGRHPLGRDAGHRPGAHLAQGKGLDHRAQPAAFAVPEEQERGRAAARVGPGLGTDQAIARHNRADRKVVSPTLLDGRGWSSPVNRTP